jgi:UDP-N-acetylmuramoyl-L-alanyl-D-glutamate--2,6-diaminopimelate ligase
MKLSALVQGLDIDLLGRDADIVGLDYDSRRIQPGYLFIAMRGETTDGNRHIDTALKNGAAAVVTDSAEEPPRAGIAWAVVGHGRRALAEISANFYGRPAEKLKITGITGTNGKTTTAFLLEWILNFSEKKTTLIGTIEYHVAGKILAAPHTTPESLELNQIFAEALQASATDVAMEVSSHALEQGRVWRIPFEVGVFTNLTRDHLDYHKDMESYFASKRLLFEARDARPPRFTVINADDEYGKALLKTSHAATKNVISYGIEAGDFRASEIELQPAQSSFLLNTPAGKVRLCSRLIGKVNVYNVLAAAGAARMRGCALEQIKEALGRFNQVPGRFERVDAGQPFTVVVDYAHTDDALRNLTAIARDFAAGRRVITVFGCGGDRDRTKRPMMGEAAARGSDFVVLTSDNPRSEDPLKIIEDVMPGLKWVYSSRSTVEPERRKAIALALAAALPGDVVLIAGKGHEKYQILREGTFPFDDVQVAREALQQMGYATGNGGKQ